jgi:hypothetical protein
MLIEPGVVTLSIKMRNVAELTLLPFTPLGSLVKSKSSRPSAFVAPPTFMPGSVP